MELQIINNQQPLIEAELPINVTSLQIESSDKCFIDANTISCTLEEIKKDHLIPVFLKDNEPLISLLILLKLSWIQCLTALMEKPF